MSERVPGTGARRRRPRGFARRMAARDLRAGGRRLGLFVASVSVGVAAMVSIGAVRAGVQASLDDQGRLLLGADLELESRFAFAPEVSSMLDSVARSGADVARVTTLPTMVSTAAGETEGRSALLSLGAVDPAFPFYGAVETEPVGAWSTLADPGGVLADAAALVRLAVAIGDTVSVGDARLVVRGRVDRIPGDPGIRSAVNPRIYMSRADLAATGLVREGSLVTYRAYVRAASPRDVGRLLRTHRELLGGSAVTWDTARERERQLTIAFDALGRFLAIVGLGALLLGGVGVASAMHVYIGRRRGSAAVLRCLGASGWSLVRIYALQALVLALAGAVPGAAMGVALQAAIPALLDDVLPLDLAFTFDAVPVAVGIGAGVWTAMVFAVRAILPIRHVPALGAVREAAIGEAEGGARSASRRIPEGIALVAIAATVVGLCVWQAGDPAFGSGLAAGAGVTLGLLGLVASALIRVTRGAPPRRSPFPVRQGVANLFRPRNQTRAAVVALGFGVFVIGTISAVESNVRQRLSLGALGIAANMAVFDVQPDETRRVLALLDEAGRPALDVIPIIPGRLAAIQGREVRELLAENARPRFGRRSAVAGDSSPGDASARDPAGPSTPRSWALRREYRNSVRDTLVGGERVVEGAWWDEGRRPSGASGEKRSVRVSLETEVARALRVGPGDTITWDFQGELVDSEVASVRAVDWARLEPNFVAVFEPGGLDGVPRTDLVLAEIPEPDARARFQDAVATGIPGALVIDLTAIQETIGTILDRASIATRFMGSFTLVAGLLILAATVVASRGVRMRENAVLRALGASSGTLRSILVTEFAALGSLAGLTGVSLAAVAGWALSRWVFEMPYRVPLGALAMLWAAAVVLTVALGALGSRAVVRSSALGAIRAAETTG
ncbi:MAG: FtsX-like permease family protein [Gemmatimonadota bacterium]|nr:FtsX-like permease family protein [Gemmatimonadota bacterium]